MVFENEKINTKYWLGPKWKTNKHTEFPLSTSTMFRKHLSPFKTIKFKCISFSFRLVMFCKHTQFYGCVAFDRWSNATWLYPRLYFVLGLSFNWETDGLVKRKLFAIKLLVVKFMWIFVWPVFVNSFSASLFVCKCVCFLYQCISM